MAKNEYTTTMKTIEELKAQHGISDAVFEGVKAAKNWKTGRQVEEAEFSAACDEFRNAPIDGRQSREEVNG